MKDILIVGTGPTGLYAWYCAQLLHLTGHIVEKNNLIGGQATEFYADRFIYDLPCIAKITGQQMIDNLMKQVQSTRRQTCDLLKNMNQIDLKQLPDHTFKITFHHKKKDAFTEIYRTILITSGNGSLEPVKITTQQPYQNLLYHINQKILPQLKNKKIIILGGGDSAIDLANYLKEKQITKKILLVHRRTFYRAKRENVELLNKNKIKQYKGYLVKPTSFKSKNQQIKELTIFKKNDQTQLNLACDWVIVQYGLLIKNTFINNWPLQFSKQHKIVITSDSQTSVKNIFAAGDAVSYKGKYHNLTSGFGEVVNAIFNISKTIKGEHYYPIYFGTDQEPTPQNEN